MQVPSTTRPLPYLSDRAAELLEEIRTFSARKIPVESIRLAIGGRRGELADAASLIFYCGGEYRHVCIHDSNEELCPDAEMCSETGQFQINVGSAARRIEQMWLIEELEKRLPIRYPQLYIDKEHDHESFHGESTEFEYEDLVAALEGLAKEEFTEEVAPPEPPKHATKAALRKEILRLLGLTKAQARKHGNVKLYLSAELDNDESDLENESYVYHRFQLSSDHFNSFIKLDKDTYEDLAHWGTWNGEYEGDEFYEIALGKALDALE